MSKRATAYWMVSALLCAAAGSAQGQQQAPSRELEQAKGYYQEARFQEAIHTLQQIVTRVKPLRDVEVRRLLLADAYVYLALSHIAINEPDAAKEAFRGLLIVDPNRRLDPEIYAPKVIALFTEALTEMPPPTAPATAKAVKRGSTLPLVLVGVGLTGAGAALAAGGGSEDSAATASTTTSYSRYYGAYAVTFTPAPGQVQPCGRGPAIFTLSGNPDGSNFVLGISGGSLPAPTSIPGTIQVDGQFRATAPNADIMGQTNGTTISGRWNAGDCPVDFGGARP